MALTEISLLDGTLGCVKRCFLPIGQGAFYCERFMLGKHKSINVVFDCGAWPEDSMRKCLNDVLPLALGDDDTIHLMFLSHLHEDHVNGVEELRNNHGIKIKEIRYPAIKDSDKLLMEYWFRNTGQQNGLAYALCMDQPRGTSYNRLLGVNLIPIPATPPPEGPMEHEEDILGDFNVVNFTDVARNAGIPEETIRDSVLSKWEFRAFNYLREESRQRLMEKLAGLLPPNKDVTHENLDDLWKQPGGKDAIQDAYKVLPGGFNANSMTVFSGPIEEKGIDWYQTLECCHKTPCHLNAELAPTAPGCLYTGDYEAAGTKHWNALFFRYKNRWNRIGCLQIPHHGACRDFNKRFLEMNAIFVASAGANNKYGHPNACVQLAFQQARQHLFCVTEYLSSCLCTSIISSENAVVVSSNNDNSVYTLREMTDEPGLSRPADSNTQVSNSERSNKQ